MFLVFWNSITVLAHSVPSPLQFSIHTLHYCCQPVILHFVLHLISSSAFEFTELSLIDLRSVLQLIKIIPNSNLPVKGFQSSFRLLSSRCFVSILPAPSSELHVKTVLTGREGQTPAEPHLPQLPLLAANHWQLYTKHVEQFDSRFLFLPH